MVQVVGALIGSYARIVAAPSEPFGAPERREGGVSATLAFSSNRILSEVMRMLVSE